MALQLDPILSVALAVQRTPGAYALLLGSGVSRAAAIPTGWDIVLDLVRKLAAVAGDDPGADPVAWYRSKYGEEPNYSTLLEQIARTAPERKELLKAYFEPTTDERSEGKKTPTKAHHAIARLVADGLIRVVITTNFDQLLETALREAGVTPRVIDSTDSVAGAMPLHLERVTVIKVHGDYTDTRIKNTPEELAAYDPPMDRLLDRVFDEYGLIVCGWSATWDPALRSAIERCPSRRFTSYWVAVGSVTAEAQALCERRGAVTVRAESADRFFEDLGEKITSLRELDRPDPLTTAAAVAALKRYVVDEASRVRLHDLVMDEVQRVYALRQRLTENGPHPSNEVVAERITKLMTGAETLYALAGLGTYWGGRESLGLWRKAIERLGSGRQVAGFVVWQAVALVPAQLTFYAAALGALGHGNEELAADLLLLPSIEASSEEKKNPVFTLNCIETPGVDAAKTLPDQSLKKTPMSDVLYDTMKPVILPLLGSEKQYDALFDRLEYLIALAYIGTRYGDRDGVGDEVWGPLGRFAWRSNYGGGIMTTVGEEITTAGADWVLLRRGLFGGSLPRLIEIKQRFDRFASRLGY